MPVRAHRLVVNNVSFRVVDGVPMPSNRLFFVLGKTILLKGSFANASPTVISKACGYAIQYIGGGTLKTLGRLITQRVFRRRNTATVDDIATEYALSRVNVISTILEQKKQ